ncbi:MAG TPA: hypothetical protein VFQ35_28075 [Polyangiaceae bacterium]|nr:hypothetical protein [Polyangiaceae bacterium]
MRGVPKVLVTLLLVAACGSEKSPFAKGNGASGGRSGQGGAVGSGGFTQLPSTRGGTTGSGGRVPDEPPGENVLTLLHGIVDAPAISICFAKGQTLDAPPLGMPQPPGGLSYGSSLVLRSIDGIDWAKDTLSTWIIAGDLSLVEGLDCEQAVTLAKSEMAMASEAPEPSAEGGAGGAGGAAGAPGAGGEGGGFTAEPPRLRAARLPFVPAGTLSVGRSSLMVAEGCIGGPAYQSRLGENACGAGYSKTSATLSAVLVQMSRRSMPFRLGLQAVHASQANGAVGVTSAPIDGGASFVVVANSVELGGIAPRTLELNYDVSSWGVNTPDWQLEVSQNSTVLFAEPWSTVLARAGVSLLANGSAYALVFVGPGVGVPLGRNQLWNPPRIVLVPTDPTPEEP